MAMCENFYHANYQCPGTCGKCAEGDPLRLWNQDSLNFSMMNFPSLKLKFDNYNKKILRFE